MATRHEIIPKAYRDSVALMQLSSALAQMPGIAQASAVMATGNNLELLREAGLDPGPVNATAADLIVVVQGDESAIPEAVAEAHRRLSAETPAVESAADQPLAPRSLVMALERGPAALALISTPGEYAAAEALKALNL